MPRYTTSGYEWSPRAEYLKEDLIPYIYSTIPAGHLALSRLETYRRGGKNQSYGVQNRSAQECMLWDRIVDRYNSKARLEGWPIYNYHNLIGAIRKLIERNPGLARTQATNTRPDPVSNDKRPINLLNTPYVANVEPGRRETSSYYSQPASSSSTNTRTYSSAYGGYQSSPPTGTSSYYSQPATSSSTYRGTYSSPSAGYRPSEPTYSYSTAPQSYSSQYQSSTQQQSGSSYSRPSGRPYTMSAEEDARMFAEFTTLSRDATPER